MIILARHLQVDENPINSTKITARKYLHTISNLMPYCHCLPLFFLITQVYWRHHPCGWLLRGSTLLRSNRNSTQIVSWKTLTIANKDNEKPTDPQTFLQNVVVVSPLSRIPIDIVFDLPAYWLHFIGINFFRSPQRQPNQMAIADFFFLFDFF